MPSPNPRSHFLRLLLGAVALLAAGLALLLLQPQGPGYAAPPFVPDASHRTPTRTPTPTPTGRVGDNATLGATDDVNIDPFIGFESIPALLSNVPNLCQDTVVAPGGEAWVLSESSFSVGDSDRSATLYVQRCVGDFQPWNDSGASLDNSGIFQPLPSAALFLSTATPESPIARILLLSPDALQVLATPVPLDRAPVLAPIFSAPLVPIIPTIEAPERFEEMAETSVTLRLPDGQEITLENAGFGRPDLWSYSFPIDSPSGVYEVALSSSGNSQTRQISVWGVARIYATDRDGNLQSRFLTPGAALINFVDFAEGSEVAVILYRVVETLTANIFSSNALAEVGRWTFTPGNQPSRERLSQRLDPGIGPAYGTFVLLACYTYECNQMPRIEVSGQRVVWPQMVLGSVYIEADASVLTLPNSFQTVRFAPGGIDAVVELALSDSNPAGYQLSANAGQQMRVQLDTPNVQVYVLDPFGELLLPVGQGVAAWEFLLAQSGQHRLILYGVEDGHMTITIPPGSGAPAQPTPTPTQPPAPPSSGSLHDVLLEKMAAASTPNEFPNLANALVEHLLAHLSDFDQTGIGSGAVIDALGQTDVGDRLNGIVQKVWGDWNQVSREPLNDSPAGLSPFRQLVVRMIQGNIDTLSSQEQRAILSWLTRSENLSVWRENPNAVIGAINREIFP
ncbi:MAG: hypothetical protein DWI57_14890 [Chloroflexi bacterium]|nr:MAG: hypothetical protein DWI57_14890 [Chloroflexota bacterium]